MTSELRTDDGAARGFAPFVDTELMAALADDLRAGIFAYLCERPGSLKDVASALGATEQRVRYHVSELRKGGFVISDENGPRRGKLYKAALARPIPAGAWDQLPTPIRRHLAVRLMRIFYGDAAEALEKGTFLRDGHHLSLTPLVVDAIGKADVRKLLETTVDGLRRIQAESNERLETRGDEGDDAYALTVAAAGYEAARDPLEGITASRAVQI